MSTPLVSVIMPVYNREKWLGEAIESILGQTFTDFELIIVDDGSEDGSLELMRQYEAQDQRISVIALEQNMGQADAQNHAFAASSGKYITFMDSDDISVPQRLQKQVEYLQTHPEIGGVGANRRILNQDLSKVIHRHVLSHRHAMIILDSFINHQGTGATIMLRREFVLAVGGWEPGRRYAKDRDLFARLFTETSIRFANLPDVLYHQRVHQFQIDNSPGSARYKSGAKLDKRMLEHALGDAPEEVIERIRHLRWFPKLSWRDRRATKRDLMRLIDALIAHGWVEPEDKPLLLAEMNRRLEQASPRLWQMFCHWRRHRLGWLRL